LRFYEPTRGRILIDGHDIAQVSLRSLRSQMGLVTQEPVIFADTIRANIAYGTDGLVDDGLIRRAAQRAHIDDFIEDLRVKRDGRETRGYDAFVTTRSLSGGQRQRLALARAILRDPPILILDEATSQVDSESERKIQEALEDVTRDRTTFVIAHRFSTIAGADVTVVLNEGRIVSYGQHAELLETCPFYVNLCETQFARVVADGAPGPPPDSEARRVSERK
jgi:subfamily B ATP-binding cassette protein MsbA